VRQLIVTGDDFGSDLAVNEAIELAHRNGILNTASLMVTGPAFEDAVDRSRRLPALSVGLHLVLSRGRPKLPPAEIPALVGRDGFFRGNLAAAGFRFFFSPGSRRQLESEIRAQFQAFRDTGLSLDHADGHNHLHIHPTIAGLLIRIGQDFGLRALRVPAEPLRASFRARRDRFWSRAVSRAFLFPWVTYLRRSARRAGIFVNESVFGLCDSGRMDSDRLRAILGELPAGVSEIYFHPATRAWTGFDARATNIDGVRELGALTDPRVKEMIGAREIRLTTYSTLSDPRLS
jgi:hopanoid biosynthesis associated protein HpnK